MKLTGELANQYDVYYQVHVSKYGWLDWASNDKITGTHGYNEQIEAIRIELTKKGTAAPGKTQNIYIEKPISIRYKSHVERHGWMSFVTGGNLSGTTGESKRMEALMIEKYTGTIDGDIQYRSYVEGLGWQDYVSSGNVSGTTGKLKKLEMVQMKLTGELANQYDIYYQVHVSKYGWLDWASNNKMTGTHGYREQIEAIRIKLIKKGEQVPNNTSRIYIENNINTEYKSYYKNKWSDISKNGEMTGTTGESTPINSYKITVNNGLLSDWVQYRSYVSGKWEDYKSSNSISGDGKSIIEMIQIKLSDEVKDEYNIFYRLHVSKYGWLDWASNNQITGTLGYGEHIEAIQVKILKKNDNSIVAGTNILKENTNYLTYSTHVERKGWLSKVYDSKTSGDTSSNNRIEGIKIEVNNTTMTGGVKYSAHVEGIGWTNYVSNGEVGGTTGQAKRLEAIKIELTNELANAYDIYYRSYVEDFGWLDWAKNGEISGSVGISKKMYGIQIKLVTKGASAPGKTEKPYVDSVFRTINGKTYYYENGKMVTGFKKIGDKKYFFNSEGVLIASNVKKIIDVSVYQGNINWTSVKNDGVDGAIIRLGYGTSYTTDACVMDSKFETNYNNANNQGLVFGIYLYSYAIDEVSAKKEANFVVEKLKKYNVSKSIPIYYDLEENNWTKGLNASKYDKIISSFAKIVESNGYKVKVYTYKFWADNKLSSTARGRLDWIAQYSNYCTYTGTYKGWQYTDAGKVNGINGNVDISVWQK